MACFTGAAQAVTFLNHAPLLPLVMADLAVTPAEAGLLSTVMFAAGALVAPFTGRVLDRFGATRVMTASLLILIASSLALGAAASYPGMLAARALGGFGLTATFIAGGRYVGALADGPSPCPGARSRWRCSPASCSGSSARSGTPP